MVAHDVEGDERSRQGGFNTEPDIGHRRGGNSVDRQDEVPLAERDLRRTTGVAGDDGDPDG